MKTRILIPTLTFAALGSLFAQDADPAKANVNSEVHIKSPSGVAKATIIVDVNGKRETREIELGNATQIQVGNGNAITVKTENAVPKKPGERKTWLGISSDELPDDVRGQIDVANGTGLIVRNVVNDSPAAKAGLQKNDVLVKFDDQILTNPKQLGTLIGTKKEGDTVRLTYLRRGSEAKVEVTLAAREGGDVAADGWNLSSLLGKDWATEIKKFTAPLQFQSKAVVVDKDGNVLTTRTNPNLGEAAQQIEQALKQAGVNSKVIEETKRAIQEASESLQKATVDVAGAKSQVTRELQETLQEARKAIDEARKAQEEALRAAKAAKPAPEKAPQ